MAWLPLSCFALTVVLGLAFGVRLLLVAVRTRQAPETAFGIASTALSCAGLVEASTVLAQASAGAELRIGIAHDLYATGALVTLFGTARLFRPGTGWARLLASSTSLVLLTASIGLHWSGAHRAVVTGAPSGFLVLGLSARLIAYGWLALEATTYFLEQRRALRFGLADPVIARQFSMWALSSTCMALGVIAALVSRISTGRGVMSFALGLYFFSLLGLVAGAALYWAFFPPLRWVQRVRERAQAQAAR